MRRLTGRRGTRSTLAVALWWSATLLPGALHAQGTDGQVPDTRVPPGAPTVSLVTVGPGDSPVAAFGHSLILFEGPTGDTVAFSFGQSDYGRIGLLARALQGTVEAGAGEIPWAPARDAYLAAGRPIWIQRLALSANQAQLLRARLVVQSGFFAYATFDENCTTTLRDALDHALGGAIRVAAESATVGGTLRSRIAPLVRSHTGLEWLATLFLTDRVDRPPTAWEAMFLPETLRAGLRAISVQGTDGMPVALVAAEERLGPGLVTSLHGNDPPWRVALVLGIVLGTTLAALGGRASRRPLDERPFAVAAAGWSLAAGITGTVVVLVGLSPDPSFSLLNENLWHLNPGFLGVAIAGWGSYPDRSTASHLAAVLAVLSGLGVALEVLPSFDQANLPVLALALPANVGLATGLWAWSRPRAR